MRPEPQNGPFAARLERRHAARHAVEIEAYAFDDDSGRRLGRLVDMSPVGVRIRGTIPLPRRREFSLRLEFHDGDTRTEITVKALCHWARECRDAPVETFESGLSFESLSPRNRARLRRIIGRISRPRAAI